MLFDDNLGFMTFDFNTLNQNKIDNSKSYDILDAKEAFMRGNIEKDEFKPYKNYTYRKLEPVSRRNKLLLEIMEYDFAINDLNLILDLHPNDKKLLELFKKYVAKLCEKELEYVKLYGPVQVVDVDGDTFNWVDEPWPWCDKEDAKYV